MADARRNMGPSRRIEAKTPATCPHTMICAMGWNDARADRPYRDAYHDMDRRDQILYEAGRLYARAAAAAMGVPKAPLWAKHKRTQMLRLTLDAHQAMEREFKFIQGGTK